ncbi:MAG: galactose-1-phosphate uridylyltransferase [Fibrobacterales bacterium]
MSEFRQNVTTGEWVIISKERAARPEDFKCSLSTERDSLSGYDADCPFCKGNEHKATEKTHQIGDDHNWTIRVFPNKFAALNTQADPKRVSNGMHLKAGGYGISEVIVESPLHNANPALMSACHIKDILSAYKERYTTIASDSNISMVSIFRNHGPTAGASLNHPHSQIIGSMVSTTAINEQINYARRASNTWGTCVYCDLITFELEEKERIIAESDYFIAISPYASRSPFETRIYPKRHQSQYNEISSEEIVDLAAVLKSVLGKLYVCLDNPDYNYIIRSMTTKDGGVPYYHWYVVIIPKISTVAGFEIGSGIYINTAVPEMCAQALREANEPEVTCGE